MTLTPAQQMMLNEALALIQALGPALGPNGVAAAAVVSIGYSAIMGAANNGEDVTDAQLQALFDTFTINKADDDQAEKDATAKQPQAPGTAPALDKDLPKSTGSLS